MDEWKTIRRYVNQGEALVARASLEAAGFEVRLLDEVRVSMNNLEALALGGMRLQVRTEDADEATALLDAPVEITDDDWKAGPGEG